MKPRIDRSAATFGVVFLVVGLAALVEELGGWTVDLAVLLPATLIAAGLALTVSAVLGDRTP